MNTIYGRDFAEIYDELIRADYSYSRYADYIEAMFDKYCRGGRPGLIADIGCGSGALCCELSQRGYDVIGIDGSADMLSLARENAAARGRENILFINQDVDSFELYGTVGAVVSTLDSLNYVTSKKKLGGVFKLVCNYLDPGGLFLFDMNTLYKLEHVLGENLFYEITDDLCYIWQNSFSKRTKISTFDLTLFVKSEDGRWRRSDEIQRQRAYSADELRAAAVGIPLKPLGVFEALSFDEPKANSVKTFHVYEKSPNFV